MCGCETTAPTHSDWSVAARYPVKITDPVPLPLVCQMPRDRIWSTECWRAFAEHEEISAGNYAITVATVSALRNSEAAYDELYQAGQLQQRLLDIRQDMLARERRDHTADNWFYRILIGLGVIAAVY